MTALEFLIRVFIGVAAIGSLAFMGIITYAVILEVKRRK